MSHTNLHFPSENSIIAYLGQHQLTGKKTYPYLSQKKIIEAVAACFANEDKNSESVKLTVAIALYHLNTNLKLTDTALGIISINLTKALMDCAKDEKIKLDDGKESVK